MFWLMKSEPETFGWAHLNRAPGRTAAWDGVRNYQARNFMRDQMKLADEVFFYHSNCPQPGIVGIAKVVRESYPDHTAFDPQSPYCDPKSDPAQPRWMMVDLVAVRPLRRELSLTELKQHPQELAGLALLNRGNRLSVMPVAEDAWQFILSLE